MLLPRRQMKPRTFRASAGQTIFVGGLARVDLVQIPAQTIYLTVWASDEVACHYGRTDKADERCALSAKAHSAPSSTCINLHRLRSVPDQQMMVGDTGHCNPRHGCLNIESLTSCDG